MILCSDRGIISFQAINRYMGVCVSMCVSLYYVCVCICRSMYVYACECVCAPMCIWVQVVDLSGLWKAFSALKMFTTLLERGNKHLGSWREIWSAQVCGSGQEASRRPESGEMRVVWSSQKMLTAGGPGRTARAPEREGGLGWERDRAARMDRGERWGVHRVRNGRWRTDQVDLPWLGQGWGIALDSRQEEVQEQIAARIQQMSVNCSWCRLPHGMNVFGCL